MGLGVGVWSGLTSVLCLLGVEGLGALGSGVWGLGLRVQGWLVWRVGCCGMAEGAGFEARGL